MLHSSLGFHTITISLSFWEEDELRQLIRHFIAYRERTGKIMMYRRKGDELVTFYPPKSDKFLIPDYSVIYYTQPNGITWTIRHYINFLDLDSYVVNAKINPKMMGAIQDYITAATYDDMNAVISRFNLEAKSISALLKNFSHYKLNRVDYCINFDLSDFVDNCEPELVMNLIRRGDIPAHYEEWTQYDKTAHRKKSPDGSFYLKSKSAHINCYSKYLQLKEYSEKNMARGFNPVPQATLNAAKNIIRFEIQYLYPKMEKISIRTKVLDNNYEINKYETLLSHKSCNDAVKFYFNRIIRKGNWYTLHDAVQIIQSKHFNKQKEKRLIETLQLVNQCRSLFKARESCTGTNLEQFTQSLIDLSYLDINPVTIPKNWGIRYIPNLLSAYYEKSDKETEDSHQKCYDLHFCITED